ncbi:hypothetical protein GCM10022251_08980 [Phytohabitans flavus]|uniref:Phosphatidylethanolamine-binding protein n=1 Tax=Phytohabitans flavus TaxID=1076124 RepID=A0A6F8Y1K2_9ACTN|nr:hypothetical protein Pflav_063190 [Phytohabitans flavus]
MSRHPRPGSHKYDIKRARYRDRIDNRGTPDKRADEAANRVLQRDQGLRGQLRSERGLGPKGERGRGEPK